MGESAGLAGARIEFDRSLISMPTPNSDSPKYPWSTSMNTPLRTRAAIPSVEAVAIVEFWQQAGPALWFTKNPVFDSRFRDGFLSWHEAAARGDLAAWAGTAVGSLSLVLLLDQFPRNAFRGTPRMYATDGPAREVVAAALDAGHDRAVLPELQRFFYLPFGHSEELSDQERSVALVHRLGQPDLSHAERHRDIIRRFGRFPHRNPILGRAMTRDEQRFLDEGGFAG
jgi:uncharacterized protein (DUF924 family)